MITLDQDSRRFYVIASSDIQQTARL